MRVEAKYFAWDETEFDTETECLAYEKHLDDLWDSVVLLDEEFHGPKSGVPALEFAECFAIYVKVLDAKKAAELFKWVLEVSGATIPPADMIYDGGVYKYDENAPEDWIDLTERLRESTIEMESIEKAVAAL